MSERLLRACRIREDVGLGALAEVGHLLRVSAEGEEVASFPIADLQAPSARGVAARSRL